MKRSLLIYLNDRHEVVHGHCLCGEPEDLKDDEMMLCRGGPECKPDHRPTRGRDLVDGFIRQGMIERGWLNPGPSTGGTISKLR